MGNGVRDRPAHGGVARAGRLLRGSLRSRRARLAWGLLLFAGMLFWTKLRLVTEVPRAGYAEPPAAGDPAAADDGEASVPGPASTKLGNVDGD